MPILPKAVLILPEQETNGKPDDLNRPNFGEIPT